MRLTRAFNAGYDNLYLNEDDVDRLLKGQTIKESSMIVQMEKPPREWVGLTDEETKQLWHKARLCIGPRWMVFKRMIEAAIKEKNT